MRISVRSLNLSYHLDVSKLLCVFKSLAIILTYRPFKTIAIFGISGKTIFLLNFHIGYYEDLLMKESLKIDGIMNTIFEC